jgi:hypothetical protein
VPSRHVAHYSVIHLGGGGGVFKFQWLQDPSEINGDKLNNVRCEASRYCKKKKREYLKDKINELAMNSKNKDIRDLYRGKN